MSCPYSGYMILLALVLFANKMAAQTSTSDSQHRADLRIIAYFTNELKVDAHLYTGKEFVPYASNIKGDPFFAGTGMQMNEIYYDGTLYENIPLQYDIVSQEIITGRYGGGEEIQLINEKIKYFTLYGHRFEHIFSILGKDETVTNTFFEILTEGTATLMAKRIKRIKSGLRTEDPTMFVEEDQFFIRKQKNLYPVDGKNSILLAFADKASAIKSFIRKNKLSFKKKLEEELIMTTNYYSSLNK
jgi:hypothetical protein